MRVSARSLSAVVLSGFFGAGGVFLLFGLVFGTVEGGLLGYAMVVWVPLGCFGFGYFLLSVSSAVITTSAVRAGWVGARRVPLSDIARLEIVEGKWLYLEAVCHDGESVRLLRYVGTQLNGPDMIRRSVEQARRQIEAIIEHNS